MKVWDYIGKRHVEPGKRRWVCQWYVWHEDSDSDDDERDPIEETVCWTRIFPTRPLAEAFARKHEPCWDVWQPVVYEEVFELEHSGAEEIFGGWSLVGEREEIWLEDEDAATPKAEGDDK